MKKTLPLAVALALFPAAAMAAMPAPRTVEQPQAVPGFAPGEPSPGDGASPERKAPPMEAPACDFSAWVGKKVDEDALKATGRPYRIIHPGDPVTMDYSADRINVEIDESETVLSVKCG